MDAKKIFGVQKAPGGQEAYKKKRRKSGDFFSFFFFGDSKKKFVGGGKKNQQGGAPNGNVTPLGQSCVFNFKAGFDGYSIEVSFSFDVYIRFNKMT